MRKSLLLPDYAAFLAALKERILYARASAVRAVNHELVLLYWDIGCGIVEKQQTAGWGDSVVERLAADLRAEFPDMRGFSSNNLWLARQFYLEYSSAEFLERAVQELQKSRQQSLLQAIPKSTNRGALDKNSKFVSQAVRELSACIPWGHHVNILTRNAGPRGNFWYDSGIIPVCLGA